MVLIKANAELQKVFSKLIETIKVPVHWTGIFVVLNNNLILMGEVRSLVFNFDNKKIYSNILEFPIDKEKVQQVPKDPLISNILNMTLYAFGRWGTVRGLTVEKDYAALNELFGNVLRPIHIEPGYRVENFRFFKAGMQITYEDTILAAIRLMQEEGKMPRGRKPETGTNENGDTEADGRDSGEIKDDGKKEDGTEKLQTEEEEYELGLWHSMRWKKEIYTFEKSPLQESDNDRSRIGNDFYITEYHCPVCGKRLYMGVYPEGKELLIETEEAKVFMARTYACDECNSFYTPRPEKLLLEGDVYSLKFQEDRTAYRDYLDLLGVKAGKTPNYKFNEFEFERNRKKKEENTDENTQQSAKADSQRSAEENAGQNRNQNIKQNTNKNIQQNADRQKEYNIGGNKQSKSAVSENRKEQMSEISGKLKIDRKKVTENKKGTRDEKEDIDGKEALDKRNPEMVQEIYDNQNTQEVVNETQGDKSSQEKKTEKAGESRNPRTEDREKTVKREAFFHKTTEELRTLLKYAEGEEKEAAVEVLREKLNAKYEARMGMLERLAARQLTDLKKQIEKEEVFGEEEKKVYIKKINGRLYAEEERVLTQKVEISRNKNYAEVDKIIREIEEGSSPEELKRETLERLQVIKQEKAEREVEQLLSRMPLHMDRKQFADYMGKVEAYKGVDTSPYKEYLEKRRNMAEKEEIENKMKRGGKKDREGLWNLRRELEGQDYRKENVAPYLEQIQDRIVQMDEEEIAKICPDIGALSFAEGLEAYEKISQGMFLPELKIRTLEMIERRLTKIKTDESVQLMHKFQHEMDEKMPDYTGFYFYDAREEQRKENRKREQTENIEDGREIGEDESYPMYMALKRYGADRDKYEYPILVCDTSRAGNGKEGFVLTPDHIFYKSLWKVGKVNVLQIERVEVSSKILSKGIFLQYFTGEKVKLPNTVVTENWEIFAGIMNEFISYLQEKPESRSIGYLAKEKHDVKCCFRCGYTYKGGDICPKCGSKMNK